MWLKFYHHFWYRMHMVHAYLEWHQHNRIASAEHEAEAMRHQSALHLIQIKEQLQ